MKQIKYLVLLTLLALMIIAGTTVYAHHAEFAKKGLAPATEQREVWQAKSQDIKQAVETNDYDTWASLMAGTKVAEKINADNFAQLVKMHQLMAEARQIGERLGLSGPDGMGLSRFH